MHLIEDEKSQVQYDNEAKTIIISGTLRLRGIEEYKDIADLLTRAIKENDTLTVDLTQLKFLNSSGIAMLSKIIINARKEENFNLTFCGSADVPWQDKSLKNLQRLMPALQLNFH